MKSFIKEFCKRGLVAFGFGPVVVAIIYIFLTLSGVEDCLTLGEVAKQILLVSILAFTVAGITSIYQIERLPLPFAIFIQASILYLDYIIVYLINGWLENAFIPIMVFTVIFIISFALIWGIVYFFTKRGAKKLNERLNK